MQMSSSHRTTFRVPFVFLACNRADLDSGLALILVRMELEEQLALR
jgi:hypothetical protein